MIENRSQLWGNSRQLLQNPHVKSRRKPKSVAIRSSPYTSIGVPFAAYKGMIVSSCLFCFFVFGGTTEMSAPVSIKNSWVVDFSCTSNLLFGVFVSHLLIVLFSRSSPTPLSDDGWLLSFLSRHLVRSCMVVYTSTLWLRIFDGNGKCDPLLVCLSWNCHDFYDCLVILIVIGLIAFREMIL